MVALAFNGFGLAATASNYLKETPSSEFWKAIEYQFSHCEWVGCSFWDMIQPSFMFMVGVSMAYSYVKRQAQGDSWSNMFSHAAVRAIVLCFLGIFLISNGQSATRWSLMNVLTQIGLGYTFLFLLWRKPAWFQVIVAASLLCGTWALYQYLAPSESELAQIAGDRGVSPEWANEHLTAVAAPWHKNANIGHVVDVWLLNKLPQDKPFEFSSGGYQTINFIPSLATMLFGLMCGELLRSRKSPHAKLVWLLIAGSIGIALGLAWHWQGCPIVKRLWTPSWALFSTGICCLILMILYGVIDVAGLRTWCFPLVVVGMNSIAIYVMGMLLRGWTAWTLRTHLGPDIFMLAGEKWAPCLQATMVGCCFWLACWWMYRNKIFVRI